MEFPAVLPQGANFSLNGGFGNCPFVAPVIRAVRDSGARAAASDYGWTCGRIWPASRPSERGSGRRSRVLRLGGGLDGLLLDEGEVPRQRAGAQQHGDAVGLFEGEIA